MMGYDSPLRYFHVDRKSYMDGQDQQVDAWLLLQSLPKPSLRSMDSGFRQNDAAGAPITVHHFNHSNHSSPLNS